MNKLPDKRIYYAQNREDLILEAFFPDLKKGFYVDVGACHPDVASVTKRFYLKGWRGINIEPQANLFGLFETERKRDINLNIGISSKEGEIVLRSYTNNQGRSTMSSELQGIYTKGKSDNTDEFVDTKVKVLTLASIFKKYKVDTIHFLKVDVEGHEFEALSGNDWSKYRPQVLCIEQTIFDGKDWGALLNMQGYEQVFFDGLNEYYADTKTDRASKFNYVNHILFTVDGGISSSDYEMLAQRQAVVDEQSLRVAELERELVSVKGMLRRTIRLLPSKLRNKFINRVANSR